MHQFWGGGDTRLSQITHGRRVSEIPGSPPVARASSNPPRTAPRGTPVAAAALAQTLTLGANRRVFLALGTYPTVVLILAGTVNMSGGHDPFSWLRSSGQRSAIPLGAGGRIGGRGAQAPSGPNGSAAQTAIVP